MATNPIEPRNAPVTLPGIMPPMPAVARILSRHSRERIEAFISVAIDLMDVADGDCDVEPNGDEMDGSGGEDDFCDHHGDGNPGCPISDPDAAADDIPCDDIDQDLEYDEPLHPGYGEDQSKGPLPWSASMDIQGTRQHRERIRSTRCDRVERYGVVEYRLRDG